MKSFRFSNDREGVEILPILNDRKGIEIPQIPNDREIVTDSGNPTFEIIGRELIIFTTSETTR